MSGAETFTAQYIKQSPSNAGNIQDQGGSTLLRVSRNEYWNLSRDGAANAVVTLYWEDAGASNIDDCSNLRIAHYDGSDWDNVGAVTTTGSCVGAASGTIYSNAVLTSFSPFTFGTVTSGNPLPITLLAFDAKARANAVELKWSTSSEINNDYFTIERSVDGVNFEEVINLEGAGSSNVVRSYSTIDEHPLVGNSYYRLKQTDFDGAFTFSEPVPVYFEMKAGIRVFPNPISGEQDINFNIPTEIVVEDILIVDVLGKEYPFQLMPKSETRGEHAVKTGLSPGVYFIIVSGGGSSVRALLLLNSYTLHRLIF